MKTSDIINNQTVISFNILGGSTKIYRVEFDNQYIIDIAMLMNNTIRKQIQKNQPDSEFLLWLQNYMKKHIDKLVYTKPVKV
jgi:hypothetical protein